MTSQSFTVFDMSVYHTLSRAYGRGWHEGVAVIGTSHVLWALARRMNLGREVLTACEEDLLRESSSESRKPADCRAAIFSEGGMELEVEAKAVLRESESMVRMKKSTRQKNPIPQWSAGLMTALRQSLSDASALEASAATSHHLLVSLLSDTEGQTQKVLTYGGMHLSDVLVRAGIADGVRRSGDAPTLGVDNLMLAGAVVSRIPRVLIRITELARRWNYPETSPITYSVRQEAIRQAVRLGDATVSRLHMLIAIASIHHQMDWRGKSFSDRLCNSNTAGEVLSRYSVTYPRIAKEAANIDRCDEAVAAGKSWRTGPNQPSIGEGLVKVMRRANAFAIKSGQQAGTNDVLKSLVHDDASDVVKVLERCGTSIVRIRETLDRE